MTRGEMVEVKCKCCKEPFMARVADRKRGWGKFCSKSCKAVKQERRTGQHAAVMARKNHESDSLFFYGESLFYAGGFDNTEHQNEGPNDRCSENARTVLHTE